MVIFMNWVKIVNKEELKIREMTYEMCCQIQDKWQVFADKVYEGITEDFDLDDILANGDLDYMNERIATLLRENIRKHSDLVNYNDLKVYDRIDAMMNDVINKSCIFIKSKKEETRFRKRICLLFNSICGQMEYFIKETLQGTSEDLACFFNISIAEKIDSLKREILKHESEIRKRNFNESICSDELNNIDIANQKYEKIFSYKDMEKLALKNGFIYKWSNGSHNVYEHNETNKIVVIPAHELGLGLSLKIQKQIYTNAILEK